ncbi:FitA-like ribbon-helix-helix domain-containing protein [Amphiplicatus metriothermophilus]|uniref:Antitoxin FitA-like ribbon-helix-helix domain-containing protein n=1 Tax=Amphiplicatus metriothermophilus TaxID=1519374 RepID=A0A239PLE7_9PROT|nr:hypothetical protein [Amphiplicatus metriothermophilus]MBB5517512.1 plasmid stability protein [Amphiplicatus metriothermophilus]SNT68153.1 hypothetical protein SAMN06297382_0649 [Amphiplicatus metriothermophilus]
MGQAIVRNLDDNVLARLKTRAERLNKPLEQTLREILTEAARADKQSAIARLRQISAMGPAAAIDAVDLIREDRDR